MEPRSTTIVPLRQASAPSAPEIFVVVKPPAGNSNPLDLQIQLFNLLITSNNNNNAQKPVGLGANAVTSIGGRSRSSSVNSRVSLDSIGVSENNQVNLKTMNSNTKQEEKNTDV